MALEGNRWHGGVGYGWRCPKCLWMASWAESSACALLIPIAGEIVHGLCSQAFAALHRSSGGFVLGEPLEASHGHCPPQLVAWSPAESSCARFSSSFQAIEVDAWMSKIPHGGLVRVFRGLWLASRL